MQLAGLDLNLLVALRALLAERNVTRAGAAIGLSQPATSAALARLRRHFGDELLVRVRGGYELTPLAAALVEPVETAAAMLERVFTAQPGFDPPTARREFTLRSSDYALAVLAEPLARTLRAEAPHVRLRLRQFGPADVEEIDTTLRTCDGLLMPHGFLTDHPAVDLFTDTWVCMVAADHPTVGDRLTLAELAELPWVDYLNRPTAFTPASWHLRTLGIEPRVEVVTESFQIIPFLVAGTDRVALIQERLAARYAGLAAVRVLPCPFDVVPLVEAMWWHPVHTRDAGHAWLREVMARVGHMIADAG
ncbi:LysR family transcriptional regulator [Actinomadura kijaniata]|uniref:LysR family transcriptional regulator n=1 Tax=Actinomadura kijaniata TaxID=46161 RepID=UPI00082B823D|nr:LysR family transcriptional regulator [Actinomadura kijaniata]